MKYENDLNHQNQKQTLLLHIYDSTTQTKNDNITSKSKRRTMLRPSNINRISNLTTIAVSAEEIFKGSRMIVEQESKEEPSKHKQWIGGRIKKWGRRVFGMLVFVVVIYLRMDDYNTRFLSTRSSSADITTTSWLDHQESEIQDLCRRHRGTIPQLHALDIAGQPKYNNYDKWTIVMTVNDGYYDFFLNWYHHYEKLTGSTNNSIEQNVSELVLYAEDSYSYEKLITKFPQHQQTVSPTQPVIVIPTHLEKVTGDSASDQSFSFGNWKYVTLVAKRPTRMLEIMCTGRNVLYVDADTVWKSNPFPYLTNHEPDLATNQKSAIVNDGYMIIDWPDQKYSHGYNLCTGFMAMKATKWGIEWIYNWQQKLKKKDMNQGIWNNVYSDYYKYQIMLGENVGEENGTTPSLLRGSSDSTKDNPILKHIIQPLPSNLFPNGREYFQSFSDQQRQQVVQVHANFIIGHDNKKKKLQEYGLWAANID